MTRAYFQSPFWLQITFLAYGFVRLGKCALRSLSYASAHFPSPFLPRLKTVIFASKATLKTRPKILFLFFLSLNLWAQEQKTEQVQPYLDSLKKKHGLLLNK